MSSEKKLYSYYLTEKTVDKFAKLIPKHYKSLTVEGLIIKFIENKKRESKASHSHIESSEKSILPSKEESE